MKLIAFSGRKQSGKDTACRFLKANADKLWPQFDTFHHVAEGPYGFSEVAAVPTKVETFYVGGPMKEFAKTFGVPHELVWGDDAAKNALIDITWESLPHYDRLRTVAIAQTIGELAGHLSDKDLDAFMAENCDLVSERAKEKVPSGRMTARQFLQQIGEEMFLPMKPSYWVDQFKVAVRASRADVGLVADPRKPEQIAAIKELGGITIRLTRDPYEGKDQHASETALDQDKFDWGNFDFVVDNRDLTVEQTNQEVLKRLIVLGWVKPTGWDTQNPLDFNPQHVNAV